MLYFTISISNSKGYTESKTYLGTLCSYMGRISLYLKKNGKNTDQLNALFLCKHETQCILYYECCLENLSEMFYMKNKIYTEKI